MPGFDGTGPGGLGPMTGYGRGFCMVPLEDVASPVINYKLNNNYLKMSNIINGRRRAMFGFFGRGRGFAGCRRGFRNMYRLTGLPGWARYGYDGYVEEIPVDEEKFLKNQEKLLEAELNRVREELRTLKGNNEKAEE